MAKDETISDSERRLVDFINDGKTAEAKSLIGDPNVRINVLDEHGMTPLQHASYKGNTELVNLLICHGADVNSNEHEHGYTALMFAAISGSVACTSRLLEAGAKTYHTNSVGRTASQMAGFVGQHQAVSLINNFFSKEDLEYYTVPHGLEKEPKLPPELNAPLYKLLLNINLHPVKIVHMLQESPCLLETRNEKKVARVLDRIVEKLMKAQDVNEVMAVKFHYLATIVRKCEAQEKVSAEEKLKGTLKLLLLTRDDGCEVNQELLVRGMLKDFPYTESNLLRQMVTQLSSTPVGGTPSALGILTSSINGQRFSNADDNECSTCADFHAEKKCSACKMVRYCNQQCQKDHWFVHKKQCKKLAEKYKEEQERLKQEQEKEKLAEELKNKANLENISSNTTESISKTEDSLHTEETEVK